MGLVLGAQGVAVLLVMKVAEGEERKPSSWIQARAMDEHEGGCQLNTVFPRNHIHHLCRVFDCIVPKHLRHLFLGKVSS
jgi:hypothetical protein